MGFRDTLRQLAAPLPNEKRGANPYSEWGSTAPLPPSQGTSGGFVGGEHVTIDSATQIAAVYGCVGLLADSVASLPLRVLDAPPTKVSAKEIVTPDWLERPFEQITLTDWVVTCMWSLALRGEIVGLILSRDRLGFPTQIAPVSPDAAKVEVDKDTQQFRWRINGEPVKTEDVWHIKYQALPGVIRGLNPIQMMRYSFGLAHATDVWAANFYQNSANPQGVIEVEGSLSEDAARKMKTDWISSFGGLAQSNLPAVLTEKSKFNPININPADQQLLESRKYSAEEIAGIVFRIPPHMVGLNERSTSFGRGIEQQERTFVANTLAGYLCRIERGLTECLPKGQYVNFDLSHRIRGTLLELSQAAGILMTSGLYVADELRGKFFDDPPLPDGQGQEVFNPINTELLEKALEELKKLEAEPDVPPPPTVVAPANPVMNGKPKMPAKG